MIQLLLNGCLLLVPLSLGFTGLPGVSPVDSLDWKDYGVENIIETVLGSRELKNGAIILLHNGTKYTAEALDKLLCELEKKGYQMVPVSKLIYKKGYYLDAAGRQLKKG